MYVALLILLLSAFAGMLFGHFRRKKIICKIRCMDKCRKCSLLEELADPFGYVYHCCCGFFSSTVDAWQKAAGYTWFYDYMAPRFQMVFDALPVYFNYRGRTWLIEFWKGQYGINTGAEIGIYHADRLLSETEYRAAHFEAAKEEEMLSCSMQLCTEKGACVKISERHWWLTAFLPGVFSQPSELCLKAAVGFPNREMLEAFYRGLCREGYSGERIAMQNLSLSFTFHQPRPQRYGLLTRFHRRLSQCLNRMYCRIFLWVTRPFECVEDRILFLYYYLPFCFRKLMRLRRFHRRCHRKRGCRRPKCCRRCRPCPREKA
ncbi:MAG: DUF4474 domain-containing protein [Oscillospiraceae bacterium]|nr:DUF4474 domain-containing protein [Oscillospiraceae bacterium]